MEADFVTGWYHENTDKQWKAHTDLEAGSRSKTCRNVHSSRGDDYFVTVGGAGVGERDCDVTSASLVLASGGYHHVHSRTKVR